MILVDILHTLQHRLILYEKVSYFFNLWFATKVRQFRSEFMIVKASLKLLEKMSHFPLKWIHIFFCILHAIPMKGTPVTKTDHEHILKKCCWICGNSVEFSIVGLCHIFLRDVNFVEIQFVRHNFWNSLQLLTHACCRRDLKNCFKYDLSDLTWNESSQHIVWVVKTSTRRDQLKPLRQRKAKEKS